jgi:predicted aconitase with swiveling domain
MWTLNCPLSKKAGNMPKALIVGEVGPVLAGAVLTAEIPAVHQLDRDPSEVIQTRDIVRVDADGGIVGVITRA